MKMDKMNELYNKLQERYWELKHDNIACMDNVKGYEHVDTAENYHRMDEIEKVLELMESVEES